MIKIARYIYQKAITSYRITKLRIKEAGLDENGDPYVTLQDEFTFSGPKTALKEKKFYDLFLSRKVKAKLPFDCYQVAMDIVIRYVEGNLKWGGPHKEAYYKIKTNDVVAEMGAFRGYYTLYLSKKVGENGRIIAIEPIPSNIQYLKKNIEINDIKNVTIIEKGVWNANDTKTFQRKATDYQSGSIDISYENEASLSVEVNTLDTILTRCNTKRVDLMLIQLNGAEYEALEGLKSFMPLNFAIAARYDKNDRRISSEIVQLLIKRGYNVKTLQEKFVYACLN